MVQLLSKRLHLFTGLLGLKCRKKDSIDRREELSHRIEVMCQLYNAKEIVAHADKFFLASVHEQRIVRMDRHGMEQLTDEESPVDNRAAVVLQENQVELGTIVDQWTGKDGQFC